MQSQQSDWKMFRFQPVSSLRCGPLLKMWPYLGEAVNYASPEYSRGSKIFEIIGYFEY